MNKPAESCTDIGCRRDWPERAMLIGSAESAVARTSSPSAPHEGYLSSHSSGSILNLIDPSSQLSLIHPSTFSNIIEQFTT